MIGRGFEIWLRCVVLLMFIVVEWVKGVLVGIFKGVLFSFSVIKYYYVVVVVVVNLFENEFFEV